MEKKKRARGVHTAVVLPQGVLDRLRQSERGVSEEIRRRIALTFEQDAIDPVTRELRDGLVNIAQLLRQDFGAEWHDSPRAHEAFATAVAHRLDCYAPPPSDVPAASDLLGPTDSPEIIGRVRERDDQRKHAYPHLDAIGRRKIARLRWHPEGEQ